ncbi:DNA-binding helix-turn-helix protein [Bacteriovorax sp. BSW11_IV]|uniref:helix-turn-helix domain-containing protein n=1 Tax=Bacteriovorax sp. BSW11_IV TaxID=1353529 RepID=UPI000389ECB3|nr:helix-turn-helix transcriptional regulator [Bacteriovorax sp. BSW11_IV]EQC44491.1 DNA-binding helix-turn-helix protein [Bacteriovorax sp. BSW11_IV]
MEFKERLAFLIEEKGTNMSAVSKATGIPRSSLHNYLLGTEVGLSKLIILADFFSCSLDFLVFGASEGTLDDELEVVQAEIKSQGLYEIVLRKKKIKKESE